MIIAVAPSSGAADTAEAALSSGSIYSLGAQLGFRAGTRLAILADASTSVPGIIAGLVGDGWVILEYAGAALSQAQAQAAGQELGYVSSAPGGGPEPLDVADFALTDGSAIISSATSANGVWSLSVNSQASAKLYGADPARYVRPLRDSLGVGPLTIAGFAVVETFVIEEIAAPADLDCELSLTVGIATRTNSFKQMGGIKYDSGRGAIVVGLAANTVSAANANLRKVVVSIANPPGVWGGCAAQALDSSNARLAQKALREGTDTTGIAEELDLVIEVGARAASLAATGQWRIFRHRSVARSKTGFLS